MVYANCKSIVTLESLSVSHSLLVSNAEALYKPTLGSSTLPSTYIGACLHCSVQPGLPSRFRCLFWISRTSNPSRRHRCKPHQNCIGWLHSVVYLQRSSLAGLGYTSQCSKYTQQQRSDLQPGGTADKHTACCSCLPYNCSLPYNCCSSCSWWYDRCQSARCCRCRADSGIDTPLSCGMFPQALRRLDLG